MPNLMQRPQQHITDALGEAQLRSVFEPLGWVVNKLPQDYGIDFEIEVFEKRKSTGAAFKVQLKSSEHTAYSAGGDFVSQTLDKENADYLCHQVRTPVALIHADVANRRTFWHMLQLDSALLAKLSESRDASTVTVRIPTACELPETVRAIIEAVTQAANILAIRLLTTVSAPDFVSSIRGHVSSEKLLGDLQSKKDMLKLAEARARLRNGERETALTLAESISNDPDASIEAKFWAIVGAEEIRDVISIRAKSPAVSRARAHVENARKLRRLAAKDLPHLKFYAVIAKKAAELLDLVETDYGLFLSWKNTEDRGSTIWRLQIALARIMLYRRIGVQLHQCLRLARYAVNSVHRWALPGALMRIVKALAVLSVHVRLEGMREAADSYAESAFQVCRLAAWFAEENRDEPALFSVAAGALLTADEMSAPQIGWARDLIGHIKEPQLHTDAEYLFAQNMDRLTGQPIEGETDSDDVIARQIIENMVTARGIDLSDSNNPVANLVQIALSDMNPGRVLKDCEHIFISLAPRPPSGPLMFVTETLGLGSAGPKILHCDLHQYALGGPELDDVYESFKTKFCDACPDRSPRPTDWRFSDDWQQEENKRHAEFLSNFNERMGWPKPR